MIRKKDSEIVSLIAGEILLTKLFLTHFEDMSIIYSCIGVLHRASFVEWLEPSPLLEQMLPEDWPQLLFSFAFCKDSLYLRLNDCKDIDCSACQSFPPAKPESFIHLCDDLVWLYLEIEASVHLTNDHLLLLLLVLGISLRLSKQCFFIDSQSLKFKLYLSYL